MSESLNEFLVGALNQFYLENLVMLEAKLVILETSKLGGGGDLVVSVLPSSPMIRIQVLLKSTIFSVKCCLKRTKIN